MKKKYHKNAINIVIIELVTSGAFQPERNECQISERVGLLSIFIGRHRLTKSTRRSELELQHMVGGPASMKTFILDNLLRIICEHKQTRSTDDHWSPSHSNYFSLFFLPIQFSGSLS